MFKTIALFGTLTGILLAIGWLLAQGTGLAIALVFALAINGFSYWYSDKMVLKWYSARPYDEKRINRILEKMAFNAKIPKPQLYIIDSPVPNALATGRDVSHASVAVTKGILGLEDDEIEGVLAHEISHIKNRDVLVATIAATLGGAIAFISQMAYFGMFSGGSRERGGGIAGLILIVFLAPLAATIVRLAISRQREYTADYTGALLTGKPRALANALRKISQHSQEAPMSGNLATSHLWIVNPFSGEWFVGLFNTHPPIERRIERLMDMV